MILRALDLLRMLFWGLINFQYSLIDSLFEMMQAINSYNIIDSIAENPVFVNFHRGIFAIAVALLGLFAIWRFVMKLLEPEEGMPTQKIIKEIIICTLLVLLSTMMFREVSTFAIRISGYTASVFSSENTTLGNSMLVLYVRHSDGYLASDDFRGSNIPELINSGEFTAGQRYNDKFVTNSRWIRPDERDYIYTINWIMAILVGGIFLWALFFSAMNLAKRQIEFLFLFVISPIVFATAIGNKERRSAVIEQLVSLTLQGAVIMLIISLTALIMGAIVNTTFFDNNLQDALVKSIMFIGCAGFLMTGSTVVNRFIGQNVASNSGREAFMSVLPFAKFASKATAVTTLAGAGATLMGASGLTKVAGKMGGNALQQSVGSKISSYGSSYKADNPTGIKAKIGDTIASFGKRVGSASPSKSLSRTGVGLEKLALNTALPQTRFMNIGSNRYSKDGDE